MCVEKCHVYFCDSERIITAGVIYQQLLKEADSFRELLKTDFKIVDICAKTDRLRDLGCSYIHLTDDRFIIDREDISGIERAFKKKG